jgi:hypothetical protein
MPFVNQTTTSFLPRKSSSPISGPCADGNRNDGAACPTAILGIGLSLGGLILVSACHTRSAKNFKLPFAYLCDPDYQARSAWGLERRSRGLGQYVIFRRQLSHLSR